MALMSPWESDLIQTLGMQEDWAARSVIFNAMASARRGEEIESHHDEPWICCTARSQWMTHPKPAVRESFFHAASELQGVTSCGKCVGGWHIGGTWWSGLQYSWATSHSLALLIAFVITVLAEICRFSNNRLFLAVQMFEHIQEKMSELIPVGGRQTREDASIKAWRESATLVRSGREDTGARAQTCRANGHSRKRCVADSISPQWGQANIPYYLIY